VNARVFLSGVAPIPWRSKEVEAVISGKRLDAEIITKAGEAAVQKATPMEQNAYKIPILRTLSKSSFRPSHRSRKGDRDPKSIRTKIMDTPFKDFPFKTVLSLKPLIEYLKTLGSEGRNVRLHIKKQIDELLAQAPELERPIEDLSLLETHKEIVGRLMEFVFPPASWETEILGAIVPISMQPFFISPGFRDLFVQKEKILRAPSSLDEENFRKGRVIKIFLLILEKIYGIHQSFEYPIVRATTDPKTGLERYFKVNLDLRFIDVCPLKEVKPLTDEERAFVMGHLIEPETHPADRPS